VTDAEGRFVIEFELATLAADDTVTLSIEAAGPHYRRP
jgi:hypothetical protein